jgi:hypothetical protein
MEAATPAASFGDFASPALPEPKPVPTPEPKPLPTPETEPEITKAWEEYIAGEDGRGSKSMAVAYHTSVKSFSNPILGYKEYIQADAAVEIGDASAHDAAYYGFRFKFTGTRIDVYKTEPSKENPYAAGEKIVSRVVEGDAITLLLSGFVDDEKSPPQYRTPYRIELAHGTMEAALVPSAHMTYVPEADNVDSFVTYVYDYAIGNEPDITEEAAPEETPVPPVVKNTAYNSYFGLIRYKLSEEASDALERFIEAYNAEHGYSGEYETGYTFQDLDGSHYFMVDNSKKQHLYMVKSEAGSEEFSVVKIISEDFERDNTLAKLPEFGNAKNYYLRFDGLEYSKQDYSLLRFENGPDSGLLEEKRIEWLADPIVNPTDPCEYILFGCLYSGDFYGGHTEAPIHIAIKKRGNEITGWYITSRLDSNSGYITTSTISRTIAGVSTDEFTDPMPYVSSFESERVQALYPDTFVALSFDFEALTISAALEYDENFKEATGNSYVYSSPGGRYELWRMNERWFHESSSYFYAVYDTQTKRLIDFYDYSKGHYYDYVINFLDDNTAAVIINYYTFTKDADGYETEERHREVFICDLPSMAMRKLNLAFEEIPQNHYWFSSYIWDPYRSRHILLSPGNYDDYTLIFLSAEGRFIEALPTDIYRFGGKFEAFPEELFLLEDGKLYLRDNIGGRGPYILDLDTGVSVETRYLPHELTVIRELLSGPRKGSRSLEIYISGLPENQEGLEVYRAILAEVDETDNQELTRIQGTDFLYEKPTGILYVPDYANNEIRRVETFMNSDSDPPALWDADPENRFIVHLEKSSYDYNRGIVIIKVAQDGGKSAEGFRVSPFNPLGMRNMITKAVGDVGFRYIENRYTDVKWEITGNYLTLTYLNRETASRRPFAYVVWRDEILEVVRAEE